MRLPLAVVFYVIVRMSVVTAHTILEPKGKKKQLNYKYRKKTIEPTEIYVMINFFLIHYKSQFFGQCHKAVPNLDFKFQEET